MLSSEPAPSVGVRTHWDRLTTGYDTVMGRDRSYVSLLTTAVSLVTPGARAILDLGCGTGALSQLCAAAHPAAQVIGLDPAPRMLDEARRNCAALDNVTLVEGSADDLAAFPPRSFDAVVSNFALHHLTQEGKRRCTAEVWRVLRPGGRVVVADQFCRIMGEPGNRERVLDILDLLTAKARYYLTNAGLDRMLLQLDLLPRFIREDGEILATPEFWCEALRDQGYADVSIEVIEPAEIMNRVVWGVRPGGD